MAGGGLALCLVLACQTLPEAPPIDPVAAALRHPPAGSVVGNAGRYGGLQWRGIPYAAPPVGERRFRAPARLPRWEGTYEALEFGAPCPQYATAWGGETEAPEGSLVGSEDCLFLNVYAPESIGDERLPVMFWIHGGGNLTGATSFYDGSRQASEQRVIVVTVQYRLGFLGWFRHAALREGVDAVDASGNFGLLDLIRALDWVGENIGAFGGDPDNVTIFGQSAGGWNVLALLASPLAEGRFHRAIGQSSVTWSSPPARAENLVDDAVPGGRFSSGETLLRLLIGAGLASDRETAKDVASSMNAQEVALFLRGRSLEEWFATFDPEGSGDYTCPRIFEDGTVLPAKPLVHALRASESFHRVPVMLGTNKDEEKLYLLFDDEYASTWFGLIPRVRDRARYLRDTETITRIWRVMAVDEVASELAPALPGEVFAYRFDWDEQPSVLGVDLGELLGAAHGVEIPFVFGHWYVGPQTGFVFDDDNRPGREALASAMMSYWTEFARTGHPGRGRNRELPLWSAWTPGAPQFAVLDTPEAGGIRMDRGAHTTGDIEQEILEDPSYESTERRCRALAAIHDWAPHAYPPENYARAGRGVCRQHPLEEILGDS
ncbi:MAG: carboxylesterase family protein [Myxococcota bacterium]|nr:carboxylesterase family protein [Myxococcota bacterium]